MARRTTPSLSGARVSELTGMHKVTLTKLVQEGYLHRDPEALTYCGHELVVARLLHELGTRASKADADRDREAVELLRRALHNHQVHPSTDLVLSSDSAQLVNTAGERMDATTHLRHYRVLGVGAWLTDYQRDEPEAFDVLIAATAVAA